MALEVCHDFEFVWLQTVRIKIFGISRVGKTNSYPMRTRHVMLVEIDDNY